MMRLKLGMILVWISVLVGCATADVNLEEQNYSLGEIKQVILSVVGDARSLSQNQRTYLSQYFGPKSDKKFDANKSKRRMYARITILGDRRPYNIAIDVIIEQKNGSVYEEVGLDTKKAEKFSQEIEDRLHKGIENRNVIDDFRIF
jgi:hypothetical protein